MKNIVFVFLGLLLYGCIEKYEGVPKEYHSLLDSAMINADENSTELRKALSNCSNEEKLATAFLIAYMPENDLKNITAEFISDQVGLAMKVRQEYKWCEDLPDSVFFNEVLPYYNLDESRDNWREIFYNLFSPVVENCKSMQQAIDSVNINIAKITGIEYNTKRSIVNISPLQAMKEKMATCTGLSILLTDAFRAVGIPARVAGTPMWTNMRGNHNWVEVWIGGKWYFTEYYPDALNKSWFLADAGKADPQKPIHWIYAASYKPAETYYPLVWDEQNREINAYNVTNRYIELYQKNLEQMEINTDELIVNVVLYKSKKEKLAKDRVSKKIIVWDKNDKIDYGFSPMSTNDLNKFLKFKLKKNKKYKLQVVSDQRKKENITEFRTGDKDEMIIHLYYE